MAPFFKCHAFKQFATLLGFKHRKITSFWPQNNAGCERFMKILNKTKRIFLTQNNSWKSTLHTFLSNYGATSHTTTNKTPAEVMFDRPIHTLLPHKLHLPKHSPQNKVIIKFENLTKERS